MGRRRVQARAHRVAAAGVYPAPSVSIAVPRHRPSDATASSAIADSESFSPAPLKGRGFNRNGWPSSLGTGGRIASESLAGFASNYASQGDNADREAGIMRKRSCGGSMRTRKGA